VFADGESRNTQLAAIQTALDDAIAREEEALE
jgi:hypothetical protein